MYVTFYTHMYMYVHTQYAQCDVAHILHTIAHRFDVTTGASLLHITQG